MSESDSFRPQVGDLKVWWIPQIPMSAFEVRVPDVATGKLLCDALADYDLFQFENKVKPDYANAGGLVWFDGDEWEDVDPADPDDVEYMTKCIQALCPGGHGSQCCGAIAMCREALVS